MIDLGLNKDGDLVKRLRNVQFWQAECDMRMQAAARIEELEKLLEAAIDDAKEAEAYTAEMERGVN